MTFTTASITIVETVEVNIMDYIEADRLFWEIFFPEGEEDDCGDEPQPSIASNDGLDGDF